jgi:hypothetical protein
VRIKPSILKRLWALSPLIILFAFDLQGQTNQSLRLALVTESPDAADAANILTAQLSGNPGIQLMERDQVDRAYREQGLSAMNTDYIKLGHILGADGLLILNLIQAGETRHLSIRLVAVNTGVTLSQQEYPWPIDSPDTWSGAVAAQFQPLFVKLAVPSGEAVPISILNLRSATASLQGETLERELTELLYSRLINEKEIFVLERRSLNTLEDENALNRSTESTFWNGSFLLDGLIDNNGYQADTVTIDAQLTPPDQKQAIAIEVSGVRTNLPAVVNDLTEKILAVLQKQAGSSTWDPQAEAQRYFEESQWMLRWKMYAEAKSAAEAAWALGKQDTDTAKLKIETYQGYAGDPGICAIARGEKQVVFGQPINAHVNDFDEMADYASAPGPEKFSDIVRAEQLFESALRSPGMTGGSNKDWLTLGEKLLEQTSNWLRYYYFTVEARKGQEATIEQAKQSCMEIERRLESHPELATLDTDHDLLNIKANNAAFWVDTPEQCLPIYRAIMDSGQWPLVRRRFFNFSCFEISPQLDRVTEYNYSTFLNGLPDPRPGEEQYSSELDDSVMQQINHDVLAPATIANPCLTGWTWEDRQRCTAVWQGFIDELCNSPNPQTLLEGLILRWSYSWSDEDFEQNLNAFMDAQPQHPEGQLYYDLLWLLDNRTQFLQTRTSQLVRGDYFNWLNHNPQAISARQREIQEKKDYLNSKTNLDPTTFLHLLFSGLYQPDEARELLPLVTNFEARITANSPGKILQPQTSGLIKALKGQLEMALAIPGAGMTFHPYKKPEPPPATPPPKNALHIGHFWTIPAPDYILGSDNGSAVAVPPPQISSWRFSDGKLWVEAARDVAGSQADFYGIDLTTYDTDKINYVGLQNSVSGMTHSFDVFDGYLYLSLGDSLRRYSLKSHAWEEFPVPTTGGILPVHLGDRMFFTSDSSILEYKADGSFQILASNRRRPAATILDTLTNYASPQLFLTADKTLHALIGDEEYAFQETNNQWMQITSLPKKEISGSYVFDDGFVASRDNYTTDWYVMSDVMSSPQDWFRKPINTMDPAALADMSTPTV